LIFGNRCEFGNYCEFGDWCKFGDWCEIGNRCKIGNRCRMENGLISNATFFLCSNIGSKNRTAYCYCNTETGEIFVRAGCWVGTVDKFEARVKGVHGDNQHAVDYLAMAAFARARFAKYGGKKE
jgi:NDP-sugar pyrophosphorylase family protein